MPENNKLPDINRPVKMKNNCFPLTGFKNQLNNIEVKLIHAPKLKDLMSYIPEFCTATWQDKPKDDFTTEEREKLLQDLFDGKLLPTAYESIELVFRIKGLDLIDVTHLIRHRSFGFSAQGTADRDMRFDDCMVKPSIMESKFFERYMSLVEECKLLYSDMVDSAEVSIFDARTILPRNLESFYFMRGNLKDFMTFIRTRIDESIQPESDNVIAMKIWLEIVKLYPMLKDKIDLDQQDKWFINTCPTGRNSNVYLPAEKNDTFEWKKSWFIYKKRRDEFPGASTYLKIKENIKKMISLINS